MPAEVELLTAAEAAKRLRVCTRTVRRAAARGDLAAVRLGRTVRITAASVDAVVNGQKSAG